MESSSQGAEEGVGGPTSRGHPKETLDDGLESLLSEASVFPSSGEHVLHDDEVLLVWRGVSCDDPIICGASTPEQFEVIPIIVNRC